MVELTVRAKDEPLLGCAKPRRALDQSVENGLKLECRAADNLQHVGGRGLLLEGLAEFVEQASVLYGDHRLRSEVLDQRDLLVGKWPHFLAVDDDRAD